MNFSLNPIFESEIEHLQKKFFSIEFKNQKLGKNGKWLGSAAWSQKLKNPINQRDFSNWLHFPESYRFLKPDSGLNVKPAAWHVTLGVPSNVNAFWAAREPEQRQIIEAAHARAIHETANCLEKELMGGSALIATFQSGTGEGQAPNLHTDLIAVNFDFSNSLNRDLDLTRLRDILPGHYEARLNVYLSEEMGNVNISTHPTHSLQLFDGFDNQSRNSKPLHGEALFKAWREAAKEKGFDAHKLDLAPAIEGNKSEENLNEKCPIEGKLSSIPQTFSEWREKLKGLSEKKDISKDKGPSHSH